MADIEGGDAIRGDCPSKVGMRTLSFVLVKGFSEY